jgi:hypothetical protein
MLFSQAFRVKSFGAPASESPGPAEPAAHSSQPWHSQRAAVLFLAPVAIATLFARAGK